MKRNSTDIGDRKEGTQHYTHDNGDILRQDN